MMQRRKYDGRTTRLIPYTDTSETTRVALSRLDLTTLANRCMLEHERFNRGEQSETHFAYELFRRAIAERNQEAWEHIFACYAPLVERWIRRSGVLRSTGESMDYFTGAAFMRFSTTITPDRFASFTTLAGLLSYLQRCTFGAIIDSIRTRSRTEVFLGDAILSSPSLQYMPHEEALARVSGVEFWKLIDTLLNSVTERLVIYYSFIQGMKPSEIFAERPDMFASVNEVYTTKRNVLERLGRNQELRELLQ
jgi:DNA-directed RNA polymerase specialized sigma24 family protein